MSIIYKYRTEFCRNTSLIHRCFGDLYSKTVETSKSRIIDAETLMNGRSYARKLFKAIKSRREISGPFRGNIEI